jgi:hypothetical protein
MVIDSGERKTVSMDISQTKIRNCLYSRRRFPQYVRAHDVKPHPQKEQLKTKTKLGLRLSLQIEASCNTEQRQRRGTRAADHMHSLQPK